MHCARSTANTVAVWTDSDTLDRRLLVRGMGRKARVDGRSRRVLWGAQGAALKTGASIEMREGNRRPLEIGSAALALRLYESER